MGAVWAQAWGLCPCPEGGTLHPPALPSTGPGPRGLDGLGTHILVAEPQFPHMWTPLGTVGWWCVVPPAWSGNRTGHHMATEQGGQVRVCRLRRPQARALPGRVAWRVTGLGEGTAGHDALQASQSPVPRACRARMAGTAFLDSTGRRFVYGWRTECQGFVGSSASRASHPVTPGSPTGRGWSHRSPRREGPQWAAGECIGLPTACPRGCHLPELLCGGFCNKAGEAVGAPHPLGVP